MACTSLKTIHRSRPVILYLLHSSWFCGPWISFHEVSRHISNSEALHISLPVLPFRALNYLPILKFMHASLLSLALKTPILITYLLILQIYDDQISLRLRMSPLSSRTPVCRLQSPSRPPPRFPSARLERDELPNTSSHQSPASNLQDSHWP
jgi:hypothetical protein